MDFETLKLPEEMYMDLIIFTIEVIISAIVLMIILHILSKVLDWKIKINILWYCHVPKILISGLAIGLIFFYDYEKMEITAFHIDDMLFTTFLIGILAIIEILSSLIAMGKDIISMKE